jgi:hypothetical protein
MTFRAALAALLIACASVGAAAPPAAAAEPSATIVSFGRYEVRLAGKMEKAERTASGTLQPVDSHRLLERTDTVMGQLGNLFGIELKLENFPPGTSMVTIRTTHPPLTNPKTGKTTTVSEYDWTVTPSENPYFCFSFDDGWEIAEGPWTMQVIFNGKVIAEKTFKVVVPIN